MDGEFFVSCFIAAVATKLSGNALLHFLHVIECDAENIQLNEDQMKTVAYLLHYIYAKNTYSVRASVLRIICALEITSEESIIEDFDFDLLIATSLRSAPPDPLPKIDEEKSAAFRNIFIQLKGRQDIQNSIARALVSSYHNPSVQYKTLIFGCLCEAIYCTSKISCSHDIVRIIVDKFCETADPQICDVLSYCLEKKSSHVTGKHSLSRLLVPLTSLQTQKRDVVDPCTRAIILLLRSWPGLLGFGINSRIFDDLAHSINHEAFPIAQILLDLIHIYEPVQSVLDGYTGLLLSYLKKSTLLDEILNPLAQIPQLDTIKKRLFPYLTNINNITQQQKKGNPSSTSNSKANTPDLLSNIIWPVSLPKISTNIPDLTAENWDWNSIHSYLAIVLPHNEIESKGSEQKKFYNTLIDYFSKSFNSTQPPQTQTIAESLYALVNLLIMKDWGVSIIEKSDSLKKNMQLSIENLLTNNNVKMDTPVWAFFKCVSIMIKSHQGVAILKNWDMSQQLIKFASSISSLAPAKVAMSMLDLYPEFDFVCPIYSCFMSSPKLEIATMAIDTLKEKKPTVQNFFETSFIRLIVPTVKAAAKAQDSAKRLPIILEALFELFIEDKRCIEFCANDSEMHKVLTQFAPLGYSYLFSAPVSLKYSDAPGLVKWWMENGNHLYLKAFDLASELSFTGKAKEASAQIPGILTCNKSIKLPPHLFGEISKHESGIELVKPYLDQLIQQCSSKSVRDQREAFFALAAFASSPLTSKIIEEKDIANVMLQSTLSSSSLMLRGTLISSFSIFAQSDYFTNFLISNKWEIVKFGVRQAVVPSDPYAFVKRSDHSDKLAHNEVPVPQGHEEVCSVLMGLLSPITSQKSKQILSNYKKELFTPECACYIRSIIGEYPFPDDTVDQLDKIITSVPLRKIHKKEYKDKCNPRLYAEALARIAVIDKRGFDEPEGMKTFEIPQVSSEAELSQYSSINNCCECFLTDQLLLQKTGLSRDQFYLLSSDEMKAQRAKILPN